MSARKVVSGHSKQRSQAQVFGPLSSSIPSPMPSQYVAQSTIDDLTQGLNEWRNIQDVVRLTFKAFHDVLQAQGDAVRALERRMDGSLDAVTATSADVQSAVTKLASQLATKVDRADVSAAIANHYATRADVDGAVASAAARLEAAIDAKAGRDEITSARADAQDRISALARTLRGELARKAESDDVSHRLETKASIVEVTEAIALKADRADIEDRLRNKAGTAELADLRKAMLRRADVEEAVARARADADARLYDAVAQVKQHAESTLSSLVERARGDWEEARGTHARAIDDLRRDVEAVTGELRTDLNAAVSAVRTMSTAFDESFNEMSRRVDDTDAAARGRHENLERRMEEETGEKASALATVVELLGAKADREEVASMLELKADAVTVSDALAHKASIAELRSAIERLEQAQVNAVTEDAAAEQRDIKDLCVLLDTKANIEDVNRALASVSDELGDLASTKVDSATFQQSVETQSIVNASLVTDCSVARWIWKSGRLRAGSTVPWNVQSLNTDPENFSWTQDRANIVCNAPGLYEVTFGFFARKKPSVQLLVNGEAVLAASNSSSYVVHHSSGRVKDVGTRHPAGNVTGLTLIDFLALPPKAKVSLTYAGEEGAEAFLSLKKL